MECAETSYLSVTGKADQEGLLLNEGRKRGVKKETFVGVDDLSHFFLYIKLIFLITIFFIIVTHFYYENLYENSA